MFYYVIVESRLRYGVCLWGIVSNADIFIAQKRVTRLISGVPNTYSCKSLLREYNVLTFPCLLMFEQARR